MKPGWVGYLGVALVSALLAVVVTTRIVDGGGTNRADVEAVVHDYLLAHPEILPEAMAKLRDRDAAQQVASNRSAVETPFAGGWIGAEKGDVVLVQFFDYACGYCRASLPDIERLIAEDPGIKVVFREFPILSPASETAARVSLAAAEQGRYAAFHSALYAAGQLSDASIQAAARRVGVDTASAAAKPIEREITSNMALARSLGFSGTPSWVIGDRTLSGAVGYEALKKAVAEVRASRS